MKNNIYIIVLSFFCMVSCAGFLEEKIPTQMHGQAIYTTPESLESHISGCYGGFYGNYMYVNRMHEYLHSASGLIHWGKSRNEDEWLSSIDLTKKSKDANMFNCYSNHYSAINRCNVLIDALKDSPVDEEFKSEIEAEARFLRAVLYFTLVRMFGDVPLVIKSSPEYTGVDVGRTSYSKVYNQIISDFNYAEQYMRDSGEQVDGRPCRWAATAYKSKVYLQMACLLDAPDDHFYDSQKEGRMPDFAASGIESAEAGYRLAYETAIRVIEEGPYSLTGIKFGDLFRWTEAEDYRLPERIFALASTPRASTNTTMALYTLPEYPEGTSNYRISNNNFGRWRPSRWLFQEWCRAHGGTKGAAGKNTENMYIKSADPRLDITMIHTSYFNIKDQKTVNIYPHNDKHITASVREAHPYFRKYLDPTYNANAGNADFYMLRLADIYLTAAEAAASLCSDPYDEWGTEAQSLVGVIHARARKSVPEGEPEASDPTWEDDVFPSRDSLLHAIIWEREFELAAEGHEFFDTHRRGATFLRDHVSIPLNEFLQRPEQADFEKNGKKNTGVWNFYYRGQLYPESIEDLRKSMLCSFPRTEMIYNKEITEDDRNDFSWD